MKISVLHNQSLLDVCLQHTGTIAGVFELAMANNLNITDDVQAGTVLQLPEDIIMDKDILNYYTIKGIQLLFIILQKHNHLKINVLKIWIKHVFIKKCTFLGLFL